MTVVIATYNSEKYLPRIKRMLDLQTSPLPESTLEILAIDGGSSDDTINICNKYGFTVIGNSEGNAIAAKHIGILRAKSRLVCFLDHDEILTSDTALSDRYELFQKYPKLRVMVSAGYRFSPNDSTSNMYASEFGDPVSMETYRCPNNEAFRIKSFRRRLELELEDNRATLFKAGSERKPILCEMAAGSGIVDVDYFRTEFPQVLENANYVPHLYYLLHPNSDLIGVMGGDAVIHDSVDSWKNVRRKISWRINNGVNSTDIAESGFSGRKFSKKYEPSRQLVRYFLYSCTIFLPLLDSIYLVISRKRIGYLNHFFLTYFVLYKASELKIKKKIGRETSSRYGTA